MNMNKTIISSFAALSMIAVAACSTPSQQVSNLTCVQDHQTRCQTDAVNNSGFGEQGFGGVTGPDNGNAHGGSMSGLADGTNPGLGDGGPGQGSPGGPGGPGGNPGHGGTDNPGVGR
jgi:hypothetical protein